MNLYQKYDVAGPRYTSFPPVPFWSHSPTPKEWIEHISISYNKHEGVDIYIHIPYCEKLCWYCGCHRFISKNKDLGDNYVELLLAEWNIYVKSLAQIDLKIHSIHFGGGTPTFLRPTTLERLLQNLKPYFMENFIGAMEVDPRTCSVEHIKILKKFHFSRISLGIQDFDQEVQKAINREQSFEMVEDLVKVVRQNEFDSINFDLIYGLPQQNEKTIVDTIKKVNTLRPDLIAFYSYAHLPERLKNQRLIKAAELPYGELKRKLYELGRMLLLEKNYIEIGLDHFARKDSYLAKSYDAKKMQRNFMGYTDNKTSLLIGLGASSISNSSQSFIQNEKNIDQYSVAVLRGNLPISKGHILSKEDKYFGDLINTLMCTGGVNLDELSKTQFADQIINELKQMENDHIVRFQDKKLLITDSGRPFLRNVAMVFDFYLREQRDSVRFSRTI